MFLFEINEAEVVEHEAKLAINDVESRADV